MLILLTVLAFLLFPAAGAQRKSEPEKPVYEYTGEPIQLPAACTNEQIATLGLPCSATMPCPIYLELTSVAFMKGKVYLAGNLHTDSVTVSTILLVSHDGGLSWTEPYQRIPMASLDRVQFFDEEHGWALGHILDGEPCDPFFLITTDGGRFWRRRPVFDDERAVVVKDFWFDSDRSGGLLVDVLHAGENGSKYERYETMTGAESWMIRQVSTKPIRPRRRIRPAPAEWRITASQQVRAWEIQKREPAGWVTVTEFQIEPGVCVPEPEVLAEAPPPPPSQSAPSEPAEKPAEEEVAPGGVFVIRRTPDLSTPVEKPPATKEEGEDTDKPPTLKKPRP